MKNEDEKLKRSIIELMWLVLCIIFGVEYSALCRNKSFNFCPQIQCCQNGKFKFLYNLIDYFIPLKTPGFNTYFKDLI